MDYLSSKGVPALLSMPWEGKGLPKTTNGVKSGAGLKSLPDGDTSKNAELPE